MAVSSLDKARSPEANILGTTLAAAFAIVFFSNSSLYWAQVHGAPTWPVHWVALIVVSVAPALLSRRLVPAISHGLVIWSLAYLVVTLLWFAAFGASDLEPLQARVLPPVLLVATFVALRTWPQLWRSAALGIALVASVSAPLHAWDLMNPFALLPPWAGDSYPGRATGLFLNPNQAGAAAVLAMPLGLMVTRPQWRWLLIGCSLIAVAATLSRSAMLAWLVALTLITRAGLVSRRDILRIGIVAVIGAAMFSIYFLDELAALGINSRVVEERLDWILAGGQGGDFSEWQRRRVAELALDLISQHPIVGSGLASTEVWGLGVGTHNTYLSLMADFGVWALLLLPTLAVALRSTSRDLNKRLVTPIASSILILAFFDHGILQHMFVMVALAMAASCPDEMQRSCTPEYGDCQRVPAP